MNEEGRESVWFVPRNTAGRYHLAVEIVRSAEDGDVFIRSGMGMDDRADMRDLESLMNVTEIRYLTSRGPMPLKFDKAVEFMSKQTAFRRA